MRALMRPLRFALVAAALALVACSSDDPEPTAAKACTPGVSQACAGPAACQGGQVCNADGMAFGACECGGGQGGASGSAGAGGSGSAGASGTGASSGAGGTGGPPLSYMCKRMASGDEKCASDTKAQLLGFGRGYFACTETPPGCMVLSALEHYYCCKE